MKWTVRTQVLIERTYEVEATDEKDAVTQSTFKAPVNEEEFDEETLSVRPVETTNALKAADVVPGREFIWMPDVPAARCRVRVDKVRHDPNGDIRVLTTTLESSGLNLAGDKNWNDMSRFLEACTAANG